MTDQDKRKIDISKLDLDKEKDKTTDIPGVISFPHNLGSAIVRPEDKGKIKGRAMAAMKEQTDNQMNQIYRQIKLLAQQANEIKRRVELSERIYLAQMNFEPIISHVYYLYEKRDGSDLLSMIGPDEWGEVLPYKQRLATVRLLSDHTWEILSASEDFSGKER